MRKSFQDEGNLQINADINGLINVIVDIAPEIDGKISLLINPAQNKYIDYIDFNVYLGSMMSIETSNSTMGFFNVASKVSGKTSGLVSVEQPFDDLNSDFHGRLPADKFQD